MEEIAVAEIPEKEESESTRDENDLTDSDSYKKFSIIIRIRQLITNNYKRIETINTII